jgi:rare lipoprotein A
MAAPTRPSGAPTRPSGALIRPLAVLICATLALLCLPGASTASSGGAAFAPPASSPASSSPTARPANLTVEASSDGMTIAAPESALLRSWLRVSGSLPPSDAGRVVSIEVAGVRTGGSWELAAQAQVRANGSYLAAWRTNRVGQLTVRAVVGAPARAAAAASLPTISVTVYRPSIATLYGPGFYGNRTACGVVLRRTTIGVANRTLPCGTRVAVYFRGRALTVPVIDRGPYANGADWDLTMAAGEALGMTETETIGAVPLAPTAQSPLPPPA